MFNLFSKSKPVSTDLSFLGADMHSHLLPGIDDGAPDFATSLELIKGMKALGYTKLITTPHVMWDMYRNTRDGILRKLDELRTHVKNAGIEIELHAAAEYFLDDHVAGLLKNNEPLLTIKDNMVLVEFSLAHAPMDLKDILFNMQMQGYQPIIAHPERYSYLEHNKEFYEELRDIGCLFQLNILSLGNAYGKSVQELAHYLFKKNYYEFAGTDLHHARHLQGLPAVAATIHKLHQTAQFRNDKL